jgi:hypothetical protein
MPHRTWTVLKSDKQLRTQCQYVVSLCALVKENEHELLCHKCGLLYWDPIVHIIASFHFLDDGNELVFTKLLTYENRSYFLTIFMISGVKPPLIVVQLFKYNNRRVMNICFGRNLEGILYSLPRNNSVLESI